MAKIEKGKSKRGDTKGQKQHQENKHACLMLNRPPKGPNWRPGRFACYTPAIRPTIATTALLGVKSSSRSASTIQERIQESRAQLTSHNAKGPAAQHVTIHTVIVRGRICANPSIIGASEHARLRWYRRRGQRQSELPRHSSVNVQTQPL